MYKDMALTLNCMTLAAVPALCTFSTAVRTFADKPTRSGLIWISPAVATLAASRPSKASKPIRQLGALALGQNVFNS